MDQIGANFQPPSLLDSPHEPATRTITLRHAQQKYPVTWPVDISKADVKEAVTASCEAIVDGPFEIVDHNGHPATLTDIIHAPDQSEFFLYEAHEQAAHASKLGPHWRRVVVELEPLRHVEAQFAISLMEKGTSLLKHTRHGFPHLRRFEISHDHERLLWFSASKPMATTQVSFSSITHISLGQASPVFLRYPLPVLSHLSFSIYYTPLPLPLSQNPLEAIKEKAVHLSSKLQGDGEEKTLDITCKNEVELDIWVAGVVALMSKAQGQRISKLQLLGHSRTFSELSKHQKIGPALTHFTANPSDFPNFLDLSICRRAQGKHQFQEALISSGNRIRDLSVQTSQLVDTPDQSTQESSSAYSTLQTSETVADDMLTQKNRMRELAISCQETHTRLTEDFQKYLKSAPVQAQSAFSDTKMWSSEELHESEEKKESEEEARMLDLRLWKLEIEVDNLNDMVERVRKQHRPSLRERLKNLLPSFF